MRVQLAKDQAISLQISILKFQSIPSLIIYNKYCHQIKNGQKLQNIFINYKQEKIVKKKHIMGFKANIDIALSFSNLKVCSVRQQGQLKFRICLYYTCNNGQPITNTNEEVQFCHPYSILRKTHEHRNNKFLPKSPEINNNNHAQNRFSTNLHLLTFPTEESELDLGSDCYLSKPYKVMFEREIHHVMETCCFRTSVDVEKYEDVDMRCQVELMFCPNSVTQDAAIFKIIGRCECKIRKLFDLSTYLPIVFDQFQGVVIEGVYQAALIDFRYERDQNQKNMIMNPENFHEFLKASTNGFNRVEVRNFYRYYREILEKQLFAIQQRHYDLLRVLGINSSMEQFRILKVNANSKIETMIDHLGGYNSHQNPYSFSKKSLQNTSSQSLHHSFDESTYLNRGIISRSEQNLQNPLNSEGYKQELSEEIIYDFLAIKAHIYKRWSDYLEFTNKHVTALADKYRNNYNSSVKERLSGNVFSHRVNCNDWKKSVYEDSGQEHLRLAEEDRRKFQKDQELWKQLFLVENQNFFTKDSKNIKIFEQIYPVAQKINPNTKSQKILAKRSLDRNSNLLTQNSSKRNLMSNGDSSFEFLTRKNSLPQNMNVFKKQEQFSGQLRGSLATIQNDDDEDHFIILVHGFQASRQDFIVLKNCLQIRFKTKVFISTCNEGRTDDDIQTQGKRFALELQRFLNDSSPSYNYKLSFVGHSMGGIIIRTALCYLENIDEHLYSFISFSTPHLGYLYQPSTHIQAGLWLLGALQKTTSIEQLCVRDKQDIRQSFMYRLSRSKSLNKFKNLALVGSSQDKYVPYQSARIQQNQQIIRQNLSTQTGQIVHEMIDGLLGSIQCKQLSRIDVIFSIEQKNFDSMIGRTAHIRYLSDRQFIKVFCIVFDKFFK